MRDADLHARQRKLHVRSEQLRLALAQHAQCLTRPVNRLVDTAASLRRYASGPGQPIALLLTLVAAWRLRKGLGTLLRLWGLWQGWRDLRRWLRP